MCAVAHFKFIFHFKLFDNTYRIVSNIKVEISVVAGGLMHEYIPLLTWTHHLFYIEELLRLYTSLI